MYIVIIFLIFTFTDFILSGNEFKTLNYGQLYFIRITTTETIKFVTNSRTDLHSI